jgi:hypothetical protein
MYIYGGHMKTRRTLLTALMVAAVLILLTAGLTLAMNNPLVHSSPKAAAGSGFTYQGYLEDAGSPANDSYDFLFDLYDAEISGTSVMSTTVGDVLVEDGIFTVLLDFGEDAFNGDACWLEINVRPWDETGVYTKLADRQPLTPVPYAMLALDTIPLENIVTVAKSGGDFTSIQTALDSITDATDTYRYLVYVAPGVYTETITMKSYVDLAGAGKDLTRITASGGSTEDAGSATVAGASNSTLRDLTVENNGGNFSIGIYNASVHPFTVEHVSINAASYVYKSEVTAIFNASSTVIIIDTDVNAFGNYTYGMKNNGGTVTVRDAEIIGVGYAEIYGIDNSGTTLEMRDVIATGKGESDFGLVGVGVQDTDGSINMVDCVIFGQTMDGTGTGFRADGTIATLTDVIIRGYSSNFNNRYGIRAYSSDSATSISLHHVIIESNGSFLLDSSIYASGTSTLKITAEGSVFIGEVYGEHAATTYNIATSQFMNGASKGPSPYANFDCFANYDNLYAAFTCP